MTGRLDSSARSTGVGGTAGRAGSIQVSANGDLEIASADASATGDLGDGAGGLVDLSAGRGVRVSDLVILSDTSIVTTGVPGTGEVRIAHGLGATPFVVGDSTTNGVAGTIDSGEAIIEAPRSFTTNHFEPPDIWILNGRGGQRRPGDCNEDGELDVSDAVCLLLALFVRERFDLPCAGEHPENAGSVTLLDWQPDGRLDVADAIGLMASLFSSGPPHPLAVRADERSGCAEVVGCSDSRSCGAR